MALHLLTRFPMDNLTISVAGGLRARSESLELLAHNLANASTAGFKADRELYRQYVAEEAADGYVRPAAILPIVEQRWTDFAQGALSATGSKFDFALSGKGYFEIRGPDGPLYTRDGSFTVSRDGRLLTREGYEVAVTAPPGAAPVRLNPALDFEVSRGGVIRQGGAALGTIRVVEFVPGVGNEKIAGNYFSFSGPQPITAPGTEVLQGYTEQSNVSAPETAVRLIHVMRQFELLNRALSLGAEMNRRAVEEVARVTA